MLMRTGILALAVAVAAAGCGGAAPTAPVVVYVTPAPTTSAAPASASAPAQTHLVLGSLDVPGGIDFSDTSGMTCLPDRGFTQYRAGSDVAIRDGEGAVLATGELKPIAASGSLTKCAFVFRISTPEAQFYTLEIAGADAGTKSMADLQDDRWRWAVDLGG